jgi:tetratricopeptide (TPR) repeat protein
MPPSIQRAAVLLEQQRHDLAEKELCGALAQDPSQAAAHSMLAICRAERQAFAEALESARQGVCLAPDDGYSHYTLAYVSLHKTEHEEAKLSLIGKKNSYQEAATAIQEALRLDPDDPDYQGLDAAIHLARKDWPAALAAAERGLAIDAEHVHCANIRAMALVKLGRRDEAGATLGDALRRAPDNALTHANQGWAMLHQGKPLPAREHFREALRLDPEMEWARQGMVEALKARNFLYRWMLAFFLFTSRLSPGQQWGLIIGGYFLLRFLGKLPVWNPDLAWIAAPLRLLLVLFILLTWTASHLFNLALRLDKFGRHALTRDQILGANAVGVCLLLAILLGAASLGLRNSQLIVGSMGCLGLMIPVGGTFDREGRARLFLGIYTLVLILMGAASLALALTHSPAAASLGGLFALGLFAFGWVANLMAIR